ncbi:MAG: hypothetical protein ACTSV9_07790 [Candidatus Thorarchaeota archaeon]
MKREAITGVLLIIVMAPALVQAATPAQENSILPLADLDIWVDQLSVYYLNWTQLDAGNVIYVDFEVTSGAGITFFICDAENYDLWINELSATAYMVQNGVGIYSTSFSVPSDGEWRIVFVNYDSLVRKHIEGTVEIQYPDSLSSMELAILVSGSLLFAIAGCVIAFHEIGKRLGIGTHESEYVQPLSQQTDTSGWMRTSYCSTCGQSHHPPNARVCSVCGASLDPPSDFS